MHDYKYLIEMLKTPKGYFTTEGFDINDKNIIFCASNTYGKWSDTKDRIPYFAKKYIGDLNISGILNSMVNEIETYGLYCEKEHYVLHNASLSVKIPVHIGIALEI